MSQITCLLNIYLCDEIPRLSGIFEIVYKIMRRRLPLGHVQRKLDDQRHSLRVTVFGIGTGRNVNMGCGCFKFEQFMLAYECEWTKNYTTPLDDTDLDGRVRVTWFAYVDDMWAMRT